MNATQHFAHDVAKWLNSLPQIRWARPVEVTIGKRIYQGALYCTVHTRQHGERAVTEGTAKPGDEHLSYRFELLGHYPKEYDRSKPVYVWQHDLPVDTAHEESIGEWYIGGYYQHDEPNEYNPFGRVFDLHEWCPATYGYYKGWKVDTQERTRERKPIQVKFLDD